MASVKVGTTRDLEKALEKTGLGKPPPSGLIPINDWGLYGTGDEPVSPFDCDRWSDSIYCGGNPISKKFVDIDIETTLEVQPCGVTRSATFKPTIGFTKLPNHTIAHIPENCREQYERESKNLKPPPTGERDSYDPVPQYAPPGFSPDCIVVVVTQDSYYKEEQEYYPSIKKFGVGITQVIGNASKVNYPTSDQVAWYNPSGKRTPTTNAIASIESSAYYFTKLNKEWVNNVWKDYNNKDGYSKTTVVPISLKLPPDQPDNTEFWNYNNPALTGQGGRYQLVYHYPIGYPAVIAVGIWVGRFGDIFRRKQISPIDNYFGELKDEKGQVTNRTRIIHERFVVYCAKISGDSSDRLPPPLAKPRKECCEDVMGCCQPPYNNQQQQDNANILRWLKKIDQKLGDFPLTVTVFDANEDKRGAQAKVEKPASISQGIKLAIERNEKLSKILGIDLLPITVPKTVIEKKGEGVFSQIFSFLDFNKNEEINSVLEMQSWMFLQLSGILGHWMQEIPVEDNDPLTAGNQTKDGKTKDEKDKKPENIILPNIALTMREQIAMQIQTLKAVGMIVDMQIKTLIDLAGTKVLSAECAARLEDLQLYFDYETEEVTEDLPIQVTFPNLAGKREDVENLANFLKEGKVKVSFDKWTVQKSQSLEEKIIQLLEMSSAIRALYFHNGA